MASALVVHNEDQRRVLQHAADILGCELDVLVALQRIRVVEGDTSLAIEPLRPDTAGAEPTNLAAPNGRTVLARRNIFGDEENAEQTTATTSFSFTAASTRDGFLLTDGVPQPTDALPRWMEDYLEGNLFDQPNASLDLPFDFTALDPLNQTALVTYPNVLHGSGPAHPEASRVVPVQASVETASQTGLRDATLNFLAREPDLFVIRSQPAIVGPIANVRVEQPALLGVSNSQRVQRSPTVGLASSNASGEDRTRVRNPRKSRKVNEDGNVAGRSRFDNHEDRFETARTRKIGACLRCHLLRVRCLACEDTIRGPCETCIRALGESITRLPCLRYKISDALLYNVNEKPQAIWSSRWKTLKVVDLKVWDSAETKTITITQDVGGATFDFEVRRFIPTPADVLHRRWKANGESVEHECSPYAIANMHEGGKVLEQHIRESLEPAVRHYIGSTDVLLSTTYDAALEYSKNSKREEERSLISDTLLLWNAVRNTSQSDRICSDEKLGIAVQDYDQERNNYGHVPIPPMMSAQIEILLAVTVLQPLKKRVLKGVQKLIEEGRTKHWFSIYLCVFILLHSCAMLTSYENKQSKKYGLSTRYVYPKLIEELHMGARTILAWFHHCSKGSQPFSLDWSNIVNTSMAELTPEQVVFVENTANYVKQNSEIFKHVRDGAHFEHDMFFLSQLYDPDWQPVPTV